MTNKKFIKHIEKFRKKNIPEHYNQIELMNHLLDEKIDHYVSISNRSDGKSFNYIHFLIDLAIRENVKFMLIARHYTVRFAYQNFLLKILDKSKIYNSKEFMFIRTDFFITLIYKDKEIAIITDLNQATDLKYHSNYLEDFPIMVYDEFLALEGDYLPDEWERLKTIYGSVNRASGEEIPLIKFPKLIYLGNAVNFSSPVLANLDLFNILEKHKLDTLRIYDNIALEFRKNNHVNEERNLRAFNENDDLMTHAQFNVNSFNLINDNQRNMINTNPRFIIVKLSKNYLKITFNESNQLILLSIIHYSNKYDFNILLKDNNDESIFLDESYYCENHPKKYVTDYYLFDNAFSKDFITHTYTNLSMLKINKIIYKYLRMNKDTNFEIKQKQFKENEIQNTKKYLLRQFLQ